MRGGTQKSKYYAGGGFLSEQGIVKPARFDRYNFRINLDNELKPWLKLISNVNVLAIDTKDTPDNLSSGRGGVIMSALNTPHSCMCTNKTVVDNLTPTHSNLPGKTLLPICMVRINAHGIIR